MMAATRLGTTICIINITMTIDAGYIAANIGITTESVIVVVITDIRIAGIVAIGGTNL